MTLTRVQYTIDNYLRTILADITVGFQANELAYYALQSKDEIQIRDKVAWRLQCMLDKDICGNYIVRREWPSQHDIKTLNYNSNNAGYVKGKKVDMAVLEMTNDRKNIKRVLALVEFKAHMFNNDESWPYDAYFEDIYKMWSMTHIMCTNHTSIFNDQSFETALYYIFLHGSPDRNNIDIYASAVQYKKLLDRKTGPNVCSLYPKDAVFLKRMKQSWAHYFRFRWVLKSGKIPYSTLRLKCHPPLKSPSPTPQHIGNSFTYNLFVAPMLWGPVAASEIAFK